MFARDIDRFRYDTVSRFPFYGRQLNILIEVEDFLIPFNAYLYFEVSFRMYTKAKTLAAFLIMSIDVSCKHVNSVRGLIKQPSIMGPPADIKLTRLARNTPSFHPITTILLHTFLTGHLWRTLFVTINRCKKCLLRKLHVLQI